MPAVKGEDDVVGTQELPCNVNLFGQVPDDVIVEPEDGKDDDEADAPNCCCVKF